MDMTVTRWSARTVADKDGESDSAGGANHHARYLRVRPRDDPQFGTEPGAHARPQKWCECRGRNRGHESGFLAAVAPGKPPASYRALVQSALPFCDPFCRHPAAASQLFTLLTPFNPALLSFRRKSTASFGLGFLERALFRSP